MAGQRISFAAAEQAFENAREDEHTDYPEPSAEEEAWHEEQDRISREREPDVRERKILDYLAEHGETTHVAFREVFKDDDDFHHDFTPDGRHFWDLIILNAVNWLQARGRITRRQTDSFMYGLESRAYRLEEK